MKFPFLSLSHDRRHRRGWAVVLSLLLISTSLVSENARHLQLSVMTLPEHAPFDGTVLPIQQVPNWMTMTEDNDAVMFSELSGDQLVPLPDYDPQILATPFESLQWGNSADDSIRQMKLTHSVVYAGNYELDGIEGAGSHPGVDIRAPKGTPIHVIANGVVDRVSYSSSGFGNLVVVRHEGVPSPENPLNLVTLYSAYAHMDTILVGEGDVLTKNDQVGTVGDTGTATTAHLHFQIDTASAPWHAYWPFTSAESAEVGGFWAAINSGLGVENVYKYNVNPLVYVQLHRNFSGEVDLNDIVSVPQEFESSSESESESDTSSVEPETIDDMGDMILFSDSMLSSFDYELNVEFSESMDAFSSQTVRLSLLDSQGNLVEVPTFGGSLEVVSSNPSVLDATPDSFSQYNFLANKGHVSFNLVSREEGLSTVSFRFLDQSLETISIAVGDVQNGAVAKVPDTFSDVLDSHPYSRAIYRLQSDGIIQGYPDGLFRPGDPVSRVEALKFIFESAGIEVVDAVDSLPFPDIKSGEWYSGYVSTAYERGVIQGYPDGTFKPSDQVNRVEFAKMLMKGLGVDVDPVVAEDPFNDVSRLDWYAPYAAFIQELNVSPWALTLEGSRPMTRGEVSEMIYRIRVLEQTGATVYEDDLIL